MRLEAQVVAFPSPELQWFKDGLPLRPSKEIEFINEPNGLMGLSIEKARPEDAGTYSLVAKNKHGDITGTAKVEVEEKEKKPAFLATLQPISVVEGFPAKLEIKTVGKPKPTLKWTHNGEEVRWEILFELLNKFFYIFESVFINIKKIFYSMSCSFGF